MHVTRRWRGCAPGAQSGSGRRERRNRRLAAGIILVPLALPPMIVTAMAHPATAPAKAEQCEGTHAKRQPNPIAAEPVHRIAPSACGIIGFVMPLCPDAFGIAP